MLSDPFGFKAAVPCLEAMPASVRLIADKGYDSAALLIWLRESSITPRKNRKVQKALYRQRNVIEHMFGRLRDFRRIATRFDRNVTSCFAPLCLIAAVVWWAS